MNSSQSKPPVNGCGPTDTKSPVDWTIRHHDSTASLLRGTIQSHQLKHIIGVWWKRARQQVKPYQIQGARLTDIADNGIKVVLPDTPENALRRSDDKIYGIVVEEMLVWTYIDHPLYLYVFGKFDEVYRPY